MMQELKTYHNHYYYDSNDLAETLRNLADAPEEAREELEEAVYYIQAAAQNDHNRDYFRILFNVLQAITDKSAMPF